MSATSAEGGDIAEADGSLVLARDEGRAIRERHAVAVRIEHIPTCQLVTRTLHLACIGGQEVDLYVRETSAVIGLVADSGAMYSMV